MTKSEQFEKDINQVSIISYTNLKGEITKVNDNFCNITGYSEAELIGQNHRILNSSFHSIEFFKELWCTINSGKIWENEICNKNKNGNLYWVLSKIIPIKDDENKVIGFFSLRYDITVRKNLEHALAENLNEIKKMHQIIENQRIQILNSAKMSSLGEMASGIAHEINNPLSIIQANATLLIDRLNIENVPQESISKTLSKINTTSGRIEKIIKGLRIISRNAENDSFELVTIKKLVEEMLSLCEQKLTNGSIQLNVSVPDDDIIVECSSTQIFQVLINLINNSYDAIFNKRDEKWISLEFKLTQDSQSIECSVTDCGKGVSKEIIDKIMQPFFTTKPIGKGTGLGLSISGGIIEKHNGHFYLDEKSVNTRFVFNIPLRQKGDIK